MVDTLYSQKENAQWRGPTTSDNYNERIENLYKDLVYLYNKAGLTEESLRVTLRRLTKDHLSLMQALEDLEQRVLTLEAAENKITFRSDAQLDTDRFNSTGFNINVVDRLFMDSQYGLVTLPKVVGSSASKVYFVNSNGQAILPSTFEALVKGVEGTADTQGAFVDSTYVYNAFLPTAEEIWERNIVVTTPVAGGAEMQVYVRLPIDLLAIADSNAISVLPFPIMGCELVEVAYSTNRDINLNDTDDYEPINASAIHSGDDDAVGWIAPGGWAGDEIANCGPKTFYFNPRPITAIRLTLRQENYFTEDTNYIYSYGLTNCDVRYDKFLDTGKAIFRFDAPDGDTISSVDNVLPQIWNIAESELPRVFDYRVLWETSYDSGVYTETPVAFSQRVWIEVTLEKSLGKSTPAMSGLVVSYS